jgi:DNA processing protein
LSKQLLDFAQRRDWLRLSQSENVGPATFRQLIGRYGSAAAALDALPELSAKGGLKRPLRIYSIEAAEADLERAHELGASFVAAGETGYPPLLHHINGVPPLLCVMGDLALAEMESVAIVGARNASAGGRKFARQLAAELSEEGYLITSGLARGIDTAAHEAAPDGRTAAVIAGGIDNIYPPENAELQKLIGRNGLLITEMLPGAVPRAEHFPRRNRIISGMSRAIIVVEAAMRSGSLITARLAGEQGREVFAVPGSPLDPRAEGANKLIREGATLLTKAADVIQSLQSQFIGIPKSFSAPELPAQEAPDPDPGDRLGVIGLLSHSPTDIDDVVRESKLPAALVLGILLELEIAGKVARDSQHRVGLI